MSMEARTNTVSRQVRRCHATILFADVCSSTQLAEICDPESLAEILFQVRQTAERVVAEHHGVINQFYGDGILAAFGFPVPHENDVLRATEAALDLNRAIAELPLKAYLPRHFKLRLHTGVHAGLIVVQDGDRLQGQYKLYGDALNTAARLADAAQEGEVFASEATLRGVLPYFDVERLSPLHLKGKGASLRAYRVLRRTDVQTRYEASISRGLTPFVGRLVELRELLQRLQICADGRLQTVKVNGDAGLGKTRLIEEFLCGLDDKVCVVKSHCDRDNRAEALFPLVQLVRQCLDLGSVTLSPSALELVDERIAACGVSNHSAAIKRILSLAPQNSPDQVGVDDIAAAIAALLAGTADGRVTVVFIDDWHWVDDLSRQVLSELTRIMSATPTLILLASRYEVLSDKTLDATSFRLDPFNEEESQEAVASLFSRVVQPGLAEAIHNRAGGNALFVEELCQTLRADSEEENKALSEVPATLHGLIESRLEQLQPDQEEVVRTAAVIGDIVPCWLIEQVLGYRLPKDLVLELSHRDLLYFSADKEYLRFKHGLTRDVIYESVTLGERQTLHRQVADILRKCADDNGIDDHHEALAYHYNGASDDEQAMKYAELSADKALAALALDRARMQYQAALECMDRLEDLPNQFERWNLLAQRFGWTCVFDPLPDQIALLERSVAFADQSGDRRAHAKSEFWLGYVYYSLGRADEAIQHLESTVAGAREVGERGLEIHALSTLAQSLASRSEYRRALECFDAVADLRSQKPGAERTLGSAYAIACRAFIFADQGNFAEAREQLELALTAVDGVDAEVVGSIWAVTAASYIWQGEWEQALQAADNARECARKINNTFVLGIGTALYAISRWRLEGDWEHINEAIEANHWLEIKGKHLFSSFIYGLLAEVLLAKGDYDGVRYYAARALMRARRGDRMGESMTYRTLARLSKVAPDNVAHSFNHYIDRALASAQLRESRRERVITSLVRAEYMAAENPAVAESLVEKARREFVEMGMVWRN